MNRVLLIHIPFIAILFIGTFACSRADETSSSLPTVRPDPTPEVVPTAQIALSPEPRSSLVKDIDEDIRRRCLYMESDVPKAIVSPLARIIENHTRQYIPTRSGAERITPGYFRAFHWPPDFYNHDHGNGKVYTGTTSWDPKLTSHPFFGEPNPFKQPKPAVVSSDTIPWILTLYGEKEVFPLYGRGIWELRAETTLDPNTCDASIERVVAGPDEIVLYPEDET